MKIKDKINIPNILSFYRLLSFPFLLYLALSGQEKWFVYLLIFNLFTDILDGWIARTFDLQTEFGSRLDSLADIGTYILAIIGVLTFKSADFAPHLLSLGIFLGLMLLSHIVSLIKFGKTASLHLYSNKIGGYIQGFFFAYLFIFGFNSGFYYFTIGWGIMAFLEGITIHLIMKEKRSNLKGLYWVLKEK
ncbi:MAG: CDP-alcohol phosphatidyltransferase family protein [Saprospiraceae bacterium]